MKELEELMEELIFLHVDKDSQKLKAIQKLLRWVWSKMDLANLVMGINNWLYLKMNRWNKLIFWYKLRKATSWFNDYWVAVFENCHSLLVHEILKSATS